MTDHRREWHTQSHACLLCEINHILWNHLSSCRCSAFPNPKQRSLSSLTGFPYFPALMSLLSKGFWNKDEAWSSNRCLILMFLEHLERSCACHCCESALFCFIWIKPEAVHHECICRLRLICIGLYAVWAAHPLCKTLCTSLSLRNMGRRCHVAVLYYEWRWFVIHPLISAEARDAASFPLRKPHLPDPVFARTCVRAHPT